MSNYDDASLIYYPSGYKASKAYSLKPTDGSGDLTFTRASTATRVNEQGLIEGVRTNLLLQSNTFNTTWTTSNASATGGQSGYDGTNNAWLLTKSAANGYLRQTGLPTSGTYTFSVYAKKGDVNFIAIASDFGTRIGYFDLLNGIVGVSTSLISSAIESVGVDWYRCSIVVSSVSDARIYPASSNGSTAAASGIIYIQDAQLELSASATEYIPTTTTAVSVGMLANVPRIDYTGGGCGKLLLEPQRTNLVFPSATGSTQTVTTTAQSYTLSFYGTGTVVRSGTSTGTLVGTGANDRVFVTFTATAGSLILTVTGSVTNWQLEVGSYATSYIPTTTTAVTRVADSASKSGISSLIGQTEGTMFVDMVPTNVSGQGRYMNLYNGANNNNGWNGIISQGTTPNTFRFYGDGFDFAGGACLFGVRVKVALAYKNGVLTSAYVNGASVGTLTAVTTGKSYDTLTLGEGPFGVAGSCNVNESIIFPTALTNAELATLTTL